MVSKDRKEYRELLDLLVHKDNKGHRVQLVALVHKDHRAILDPRAFKEYKV